MNSPRKTSVFISIIPYKSSNNNKETSLVPVDKRGFFDGRGRRTRTLKNGFGDRYVTITSCPYNGNMCIIAPNRCNVKHFL